MWRDGEVFEVTGAVVWRQYRYAAHACRCGLVYTSPGPPPVDEASLTDEHVEPFYAAPAEDRAAWLASVCEGGSLLEVGCGAGAQLAAFAAQGFTVEGIEAHPGRSEAARSRTGAPRRGYEVGGTLKWHPEVDLEFRRAVARCV